MLDVCIMKLITKLPWSIHAKFLIHHRSNYCMCNIFCVRIAIYACPFHTLEKHIWHAPYTVILKELWKPLLGAMTTLIEMSLHIIMWELELWPVHHKFSYAVLWQCLLCKAAVSVSFLEHLWTVCADSKCLRTTQYPCILGVADVTVCSTMTCWWKGKYKCCY